MSKDPNVNPVQPKPVQPKPAQARPAPAKAADAKGKAPAADAATQAPAAMPGAARKPATVRLSADLEQRIQQRAYELWEREGRPEGREQDHWQQAEREIAGRSASH